MVWCKAIEKHSPLYVSLNNFVARVATIKHWGKHVKFKWGLLFHAKNSIPMN